MKTKQKLTHCLMLSALILTLIAFSFITVAGLFTGCRIEIDWASENIERVLFVARKPLAMLFELGAMFVLSYLMLKRTPSRGAILAVTIAMLLTVTVGGLLFVEGARALPYADSASLIDLAKSLLNGDYTAIDGSYYLHTYPFQMGFLRYLESGLALFGTDNYLMLQRVNVLLLALSNLVVVGIAKRLFETPCVTFFTALLLLLFIQPIFLTTFLYGNIPGMLFANFSIYFALRAKESWIFYIPAGLCIAIAITLKMNFAIVLIALVIVLVFNAIRDGQLRPAIAAAAIVTLTLVVTAYPQKHYERRADTTLGAGTPQMAWLVTGLRESSLCCGWYNSYTSTILMQNGYDQEQTKAVIREDLRERIGVFAARPRYAASFFTKKLLSQWLEPGYQCIWSSAAGLHDGEPAPVVQSLYTGWLGDRVHTYFMHLMFFVYVSFLLGLIALTRQPRPEALIPPLILLGALLYHLLFEAKSQYVLVYIPLMFPVAAEGLVQLAERIRQRIHR